MVFMEKINPVQQYVKQINSVTIPYGEADIFDFLTH